MARTTQRNNEYGGYHFANRIRLGVEIVRDTREACSLDYIIIFHLSLLDLVEDESTWEEVKALAQALEDADADVTILNMGTGWLEARIRERCDVCRARRCGAVVSRALTPHRCCLFRASSRDASATIATSMPQDALASVTQKLREENIISVTLCSKRSRPCWIVPDCHPEHRVFSLFPSHEHEPHQCPRHHRSDPGQLHQSICQSSGHNGGTIFDPALARHVLTSASSVRGSPQVCYPPQQPKSWWGGHTNWWRDDFLLPG